MKAACVWLLYLQQMTPGSCRSRWSVFGKFILPWVVSSSSSCSIDFSQRINYQRQSQASLKWAEGELMFSFPRSLLATVQSFSGAQGSGPCQGRAVRSIIHLLCGCLEWPRHHRHVPRSPLPVFVERSLRCPGWGWVGDRRPAQMCMSVFFMWWCYIDRRHFRLCRKNLLPRHTYP